MAREGEQVIGVEPRPGRFQVGCRHATRQLHAQIHRRRHRRVEKISQPRRAQNIDDLMRIADRRGDAMGVGPVNAPTEEMKLPRTNMVAAAQATICDRRLGLTFVGIVRSFRWNSSVRACFEFA